MVYAPIPPFIHFQPLLKEISTPRESLDASIPVVIPIIIPIVMVPMMVPLPPILVCVMVVAMAVTVVIVRSVLLIAGVNVNAKPIVCFGLSGCESNQSNCR